VEWSPEDRCSMDAVTQLESLDMPRLLLEAGHAAARTSVASRHM
jgi:hypothetical protein